MGQHRRKLLALALLAAFAPAHAQLPSGGQVVAGTANIANAGTRQLITQASDRAVINWQEFSIAAGYTVRFDQPSASSVILNRVVGNDPSSIFGTMSSNGQVFLVNPNGIYFAPGARLDVGSLVASTLAIRDSDFLSGRYEFMRSGGSDAAKVINEGIIKARDRGYVVLAGDYVANRGVVEARLGSVLLGSGNHMTLDVVGDSLVDYAVNERNVARLAGVANSGQLLADGGRVVMTASTARSLAASAVNNSGLIQARGVEEKDGSVMLLSDGGDIALEATSRIDVSGERGGGSVLVGGNFHGAGPQVNAATVRIAAGATITADAEVSGNGGQVAVWSDDATSFKGSISARGGALGGDGGFVEVSGKRRLGFAGTVDTRAPQGKTGTLLLDPADITISVAADSDIRGASPFGDLTDNGGVSNLNVTTLETALGLSNVTVSTATASGANAGNITVLDPVTWASTSTLYLVANNAIALNAVITGTAGTLSLNAGGGVTQTAALTVGKLELLGAGSFNLAGATNSVGTLAANVAGSVNFKNAGALDIGIVASTTGLSTGGNSLRLDVGGALTQQAGANVAASSLELRSSAGDATLANSGNAIGSFAAATDGAITLRTSGALAVGTVGGTAGVASNGNPISLQSGGAMTLSQDVNAGTAALTLTAGAGVNQSGGAITADSLELAGAGNFTLASAANNVATLGGNVAGAITYRDADALSIGNPGGTNGLNTNGNALKLTVGGALSQTGALQVSQFELDSLAGTVVLTNAGNSINFIGAESRDDFSLTNSSANLYIRTAGAKTGISTNNHNFTLVDTGTVWLGDGSTNGPISAGIGTIDLSAYRLLQYGASPVVADKLVVRTTNYVGLSGSTNWVNTLALSATGPGGGNVAQSLDFLNGGALSIGTVGGVTGLNAAAHVKVAAGGDITLDSGVNLGSGHLGLFAPGHTIDAKSQDFSNVGALGVQANSVINLIGTPIGGIVTPSPLKFLAADVQGDFRFQAQNELTIGNVWGLLGIKSTGNIWLTAGQFGASGAFPAYSSTRPASDYRDATTGKYRAGLMIDETINANGGWGYIYLDSASGVYQWGTDLAASPTPASRPQAKIVGIAMLVTGEGQFDMMLGDNRVPYLAADVNGSFNYATSSPVNIYHLTYAGVDLHGIRTRADTLISGSVAGGDAQYNAHSILLAASDDPSGSANAMNIWENIVADSKGAAAINLSVGASDTHKNAQVATFGGASITGSTLILGAQQNRGTFYLTTNVASLSAAGGQTMWIDNSAYTGRLDVLGIGTSQGGGSPTPVGNFYLTTGGEMLLLGGKSAGDYLQLRTDKLTVFGTMEMKDGARVLLQPYHLANKVGIHDQFDWDTFTPTTNYTRALFQQFNQTATFYIGSTPALMNNDAAVPWAVKNLNLTGDIHIGADGDGGLKMGYRSLSAETSGSIVAHPMGDVYNLRLVAPTVTAYGFNATGDQVDLFADTLNLSGAASAYGLPNFATVTLRPYTNKAVSIGWRDPGHSGDMYYSWDLLDKLAKGPRGTIVISGTTDAPLGGSLRLAPAELTSLFPTTYRQNYHQLNSKLILSTGADISASTHLIWDGYTLKDWNSASGTWPVVDRVESGNTGVFWSTTYTAAWAANASRNNYGTASAYSTPATLHGYGAAGGTWGGCANLTVCQGTNPSIPTGPTIVPGGGGGGSSGGGTGSCTGDSCSSSDFNKPPLPPAQPPSDPTATTTGDASNTTGGGENSGDNSDTNDTTSSGDPTDGGDPGSGMDDGGPSDGSDTTSDSDSSFSDSSSSDAGDGSDSTSSTTGDSDGGTGGGGGGGSASDSDGTSDSGSTTGGDSSGGSDTSGGDSGSGSDASSGDQSGSGGGGGDGSSGADSGSGGEGSSSAGDGSGRGDGSAGDASGGSGSGGGDEASGGDGSASGRGGGASADGDGSGGGAESGGGAGTGGDSGSGGDASGDSSAAGSGRGDGGGDAAGGGTGRGEGSGEGTGEGDAAGGGRAGSGSGGSGDEGASGGGSGRGDGAGSGAAADSGTEGGGSGAEGGSSGKEAGSGGGDSAGAEAGSARGGQGEGADGAEGGASGRGDRTGAAGGGSGRAEGQGGAQSGAEGGGQTEGGGSGVRSGRGGSSGARTDNGTVVTGGQTLCVGQQNAQRGKELPENGAPLSKQPLVGVREGGVNMDSDCSRQGSVTAPATAGSR